jgi:fructose-1,6-bisphosphatase/inositol monophosphatase family enzyme
VTNSLQDFTKFMAQQLVPGARGSLKKAFLAYCNGDNIEVETKDDGTPASRADRDTEKLLRKIIKATYPAHGIIGEEFGSENIDAEFVWVLDPLDGTREFLAKEAGWGSLIALLHKGKPVLGTIIDPMLDKIWDQNALPMAECVPKPLEKTTISTTSPKAMFENTIYEQGAQVLYETCAVVRDKLNCLGFAYAADGTLDIAVENKLKLHDIAALLPALWVRGATCRTLEDKDYKDIIFDAKNDKARYSLVTGLDENLVAAVIQITNGKML